MLQCPAILDARSAVLKQLPDHIITAIRANDNPRVHTLNIVNACMNHDDGLALLLDAVRFFDGETKQFQALTAFIDTLGDEKTSKKEKILPADNAFLARALEIFYRAPALILLAQEHRAPPASLEELEKRLRKRFPETRRLTPLNARHAVPETYFSHLGELLDLAQPVRNDAELERALWEHQRKSGQPLCLLISRLEKGDGERADEFAGVLRNLLEQPELQLQVLLCGGQKLAELSFEDGASSLLNIAEVLEWPDFTPDDAQGLYLRRFPGRTTPPDTARIQKFLELSGGHPLLLRRCFEGALLHQESAIVSAFSHLRKHDEVRAWLEQTDLGPAPVYIFDAVLRKLYWSNLLAKRDNRLVWRCPAIRQTGREVFYTSHG